MNNNMLYGILFIIAILLFWYWYNNKPAYPNYGQLVQETGPNESSTENLENRYGPQAEEYPPNSPRGEMGEPVGVEEPLTNPSTCYPKDQLTPEELLPQDYSSTWAKCNPTGAGSLDGKNFLDAGHHIGINTVGQTLRNSNLQLRSEPPNPQVQVSPWLTTTIEPDTNRRLLEIGNCGN